VFLGVDLNLPLKTYKTNNIQLLHSAARVGQSDQVLSLSSTLSLTYVCTYVRTYRGVAQISLSIRHTTAGTLG
jgi:hypothetical protein